MNKFDTQLETWRTISENSKYSVSSKGRIKHNRTNKILKQRKTHDGYVVVGLNYNKGTRYKLVSRLVAKHFLKNINNLPQVNHKDGNKENNNVKNLEWCTQSHNMQHAFKTGLIKREVGEKHPRSKLIESQVKNIRALEKIYTIDEISTMFNVSKSCVAHIIKRRNWKHV